MVNVKKDKDGITTPCQTSLVMFFKWEANNDNVARVNSRITIFESKGYASYSTKAFMLVALNRNPNRMDNSMVVAD